MDFSSLRFSSLLTELHISPYLAGEVDFGGVVAPGGGNFLKCARSIGDAQYKRGPRERHLICAEPEVRRTHLP